MNCDYSFEELLPIVCKLSEQYTQNDSTSVTFDTANSLMDAVIYCINYLKTDNKLVPKELSAEQAYRLGYELVVNRTKVMIEGYNDLSGYFEDYGVECLRNTFQVQFPDFFLHYDPKFKPHDYLFLFDYPVLCDISQLQGIEAFEKYFKCISYEQAELAKVGTDAVKHKLFEYYRDYRNLYENIYWIVFQQEYHII
ncbi:MAG: hypothetical protein J6X60_08160 [Ruminiclostridium sp.]|nr:hypothetical protein [Ruminiclostridium sp.]